MGDGRAGGWTGWGGLGRAGPDGLLEAQWRPRFQVILASVYGFPGTYVFHVSHRRKCVFVSRVKRFLTFPIAGRVTCWRQKVRNTQNLEAPVKEHKAGRTCVSAYFTFTIAGRVTLRRQKPRNTQNTRLQVILASVYEFSDHRRTGRVETTLKWAA